MGVFGAGTAGWKVAPVKRGHRYRDGSGRTERRLQALGHAEPGTIRTVTGTANAPVVAASWHPAIRQRYRGEFGAAPPSAPLSAANSGQIVAGIRPVITQHNRGTSEYPHRVRGELAPRYRRRNNSSVIGAPAPSAELTTKSGTIRPAIRQRNCGRSGKYPPRYRAPNSGQLAASIRPVVFPAYSGQIAGHHPPRGLAANSRRE
jgi:hypothetical protein